MWACPAPKLPVEDRLKKLDDLCGKGLISQKDYDTERAEILEDLLGTMWRGHGLRWKGLISQKDYDTERAEILKDLLGTMWRGHGLRWSACSRLVPAPDSCSTFGSKERELQVPATVLIHRCGDQTIARIS